MKPGRGGYKSTETCGAAEPHPFSFSSAAALHQDGKRPFLPQGELHTTKANRPASASDSYGFRQVELLLSASHSLRLFSPSHLFIVKPLRWDITSGVWKCSAQRTSDFDQGFWGSVF